MMPFLALVRQISARACNEATRSLSRFVARLIENKRLDAAIVAFHSIIVERPGMLEVTLYPPAILGKRPIQAKPTRRQWMSVQSKKVHQHGLQICGEM